MLTPREVGLLVHKTEGSRTYLRGSGQECTHTLPVFNGHIVHSGLSNPHQNVGVAFCSTDGPVLT